MKKTLFFVLMHWVVIIVAQPAITPIPDGTKEIHFVYEQKAKVYMDDSGIYMDTLMMKVYYPKVSYVVKQHPKNDTLQWAFSQSNSFSKKELVDLKAMIYHTNEKYFGVYKIREKQVKIKAERDDSDARMFFDNVFKERYFRFYYTIINNYVKQVQIKNFPSATYKEFFDKIIHSVVYTSDPMIGFYTGVVKNIQYKSIVNLNPMLPKEISIDIFDTKFGIERINSFDRTLELTAITYIK